MLCPNRPEGFGPRSILSAPIPTTCFIDVILVPLPVWVALALLPILFFLSKRHRTAHFDPSTAHLRTQTSRNCAYKTVVIIYYVAIVCNILMQTLEIVRLALLDFGIGLLPFVYVGCILGALLHWSEGAKGKIWGWQAVNAVIWAGGLVMCVVKLVGEVLEGIKGREGTKYPVVDELTDVAVMAGLYVAIGLLEIWLGVWRARRRSGGVDGSSGRGMSPAMKLGDLAT